MEYLLSTPVRARYQPAAAAVLLNVNKERSEPRSIDPLHHKDRRAEHHAI